MTMIQKFILSCVLLITIVITILGQREENKTSGVLFNELDLTSKEIAQKAGYSAECHQVITQDGYILLVDRIAGSKKSPPSDNKTAILLLHGILDASPTWLVAGPEKALGFILADEGYDVWLGNVRGNRYSRGNLNLTTSDADFWNFSWNEMGLYDLPAMIDHIIDQTRQQKIFYISHSQGTTAFFVMASEKPEYQEKLVASFTLAPVAFLSRIRNPFLQLLATYTEKISSLAKLLSIYELKPSNRLVQMILGSVCRDGLFSQFVCTGILSLIGGVDDKLNTTLLPLIMQYWPAGTSIKQLAHFGQLIRSGRFRKFDYGLAGNLENYNDTSPSDYNLHKITLPVYLIYAANDILTDVEDIRDLYELLPNATKFLVPCDVFGHYDFVWGEDANTLVYNEVLSIMGRYRN